MVNFKYIVDILSSLASLIAILTVSIVLLRIIRKPLKVKYVVYYEKNGKLEYIVRYSNVRAYPVTIKNTRCYKNRSFTIETSENKRPNLATGFHPFDIAIVEQNDHIIEPYGTTEVTYVSEYKPVEIKQLVFDLSTSHGDMYTTCKKVEYVEMAATLNFGESTNSKVFTNKFKAYIYYWWQRVAHWNES